MRQILFALRPVWRRPAFAVTAIVTLGVAIGANTTVLSGVDALLLRPLPYADPGRLVAIWPAKGVANQEIADVRERSRSYDQVAGFSPGWLVALTDVATPRQLSAARVTGNFFDMLGVAPFAGRTFGMDAERPGAAPVVVLGYELWQSAFAGDAGIVGRPITLNGQAFTVVAVMPKSFRTFDASADLWYPLTMDPTDQTWSGATGLMYGKLRRGATAAQATAELAALAPAMQAEFHRSADWSRGAHVEGLRESMVGGVKNTILVLFAAVAFLLLIAVANVANLFLVRTAERRQELAVRSALGASPSRIAMLLLCESLTLGALGGVLGIALAVGGVRLLRLILPASLPRLDEIGVDARVLAAAVTITAGAAIAAGIAPSLEGVGSKIAGRIRSGRTVAGGGRRARGVLVAVEVALALVLTVGATIMGRTLVSLHDVDSGFRTDHLLTMRLQQSAAAPDAARAYWRDLLGRVRGVPGVVSAATILHLPTSGRNWDADIEIEGRALRAGASPPHVPWQSVSTGYFATAGIQILRGRDFGSTDVAGTPPVIAINGVLAKQLFSGEDPIGKRVRAGFATAQGWATIVAVVSSVRQDSLNGPAAPSLYVPFEQRVVGANSLVVRTTGDPALLANVISERIWSIDRNVPISDVRTMEALYSGSLQRQRMTLTLFAIFAGVGLLLSAVGVFGVVAYGARRRTREIGVRVALGADSPSIRRLVMREGLLYACIGVAAGLVVAIFLSRFMRGMVYGVSPADPLSFAVIPAVLLGVAALASWAPARRATRMDPLTAIRSE